MCKMGFASRWIKLIMTCIRSVTYSILVNGHQWEILFLLETSDKGIHYSPYLFILCVEVLSSLLYQAARSGYILGVSTSKHGPRLSYLFFADDSLLFCKANSLE